MNINVKTIIDFQNKILNGAFKYQIFIAFLLAALDVIQVFLLSVIFSSRKDFIFFGISLKLDEYSNDLNLYYAISITLVIKYLVSFLVNKKSHKINFNFQKNLSNNLLKSHYGESIEKLIKVNIRKKLKLYQKDSDDVCYQIFNQIIYIYVEILVLIGLLFAMLYLSTVSTVILIISVAAFFLINHKIKGRFLNSTLEIKNNIEIEKFEILSEAINNSVNAKYFYAQEYFINKLEKITQKLSNISIKEYLIRDAEKYIFELCLILLLVYIASNSNNIYSSTFILISMLKIGMSSIKLSNYTNQVKQNILKFNELLSVINTAVYSSSIKSEQLKINKIEYSGNINFKIGSAGIYLIKGKSGSGKTTLLNELLGFNSSILSEIKINGIKRNLSGVSVGLCPQDKKILIDSVRANITFDKRLEDKKFKEGIEFSSLQGFDLDRYLPLGASSISGGEAQRICLARAFYNNQSNIFLLDEPLTGLDSANIKNIYNNIIDHSKNNIFIIVSHDSTFDDKAKLIINL